MAFAQKLISTRRGSLYVAVIAALLAGAVIAVYLKQYRDSVNSGTTPVTVLVARQAIAKGTPASVITTRSLYTATTIHQSQLRNGALSDPANLTGKIAAHDIVAGSQLTAADFVGDQGSLAATLTGDQRIVSVPLDGAHGLSGDLKVGDHVDVYAGFNVIPLQPDGTPLNGGQSRAVLRLIVPNVPVVAIGNKSTLGTSTVNISLRVSDPQAAKIDFSSDNGKLWLSLRPADGGTASSPQIVTVESLLLGVRPVNVIRSLGGRG
jgi:pilus assembly protein CpaB